MDHPSEERAIYLALVLAGLLPSVGTLARHGAAGAGLTISLLMIATGAIGLVSDSYRTRRGVLPAARTVDRPSRSQTR